MREPHALDHTELHAGHRQYMYKSETVQLQMRLLDCGWPMSWNAARATSWNTSSPPAVARSGHMDT